MSMCTQAHSPSAPLTPGTRRCSRPSLCISGPDPEPATSLSSPLRSFEKVLRTKTRVLGMLTAAGALWPPGLLSQQHGNGGAQNLSVSTHLHLPTSTYIHSLSLSLSVCLSLYNAIKLSILRALPLIQHHMDHASFSPPPFFFLFGLEAPTPTVAPLSTIQFLNCPVTVHIPRSSRTASQSPTGKNVIHRSTVLMGTPFCL